VKSVADLQLQAVIDRWRTDNYKKSQCCTILRLKDTPMQKWLGSVWTPGMWMRV